MSQTKKQYVIVFCRSSWWIDESNLDGWVGNYVRTSTIRRSLDGAGSTT